MASTKNPSPVSLVMKVEAKRMGAADLVGIGWVDNEIVPCKMKKVPPLRGKLIVGDLPFNFGWEVWVKNPGWVKLNPLVPGFC